MRRLAACFGAAAALTLAAPSRAAAPAPAFAPPGRGQAGLAVGVDAQGVLRAKLCPAQPCDVSGGLDLGVPAELRAGLARARIAVVGIGGGRRAVVVSVPGAKDGQSFESVVSAPLVGAVPLVAFAGLTGLVEGPDGVRHGKSVTVFDPDESGARSIVVGTEREDLELCGRPAVLAPELLNPEDLRLRPAKVQRLAPAERASALRVVAGFAPGTASVTGGVLRALGASSAIGAPQALTDGRPDTSWAENRGGAGRGEFIVMSAPESLPITAFDLVVSAAGAPVDPGSLPRELWIATRRELVHVTLPDEAKSVAGARFRVALPKPVHTDCVALVQESAFAERADSRVAVFEISVASEFENADPASLVGALAGGGERARAAGAVLRSLGEPGFRTVAAAFNDLDEGGRRVALDVVDSAPCAISVPAYVTALGSGVEGQELHAQDRLRRCGRQSAEPLAARFNAERGLKMLRYAAELTIVAPDRAAQVFTARLGGARASERRALRVALARAASSPEATRSVRDLLADDRLPPAATLDLLRALGPRTAELAPESSVAVARLASDPSFRTRYLLLGPAAALGASDEASRSVLVRALAPQPAKDSWLRVRAIEVAPRSAEYAPAFVAALRDENVRVREAAARALGEGGLAEGRAGLLDVLGGDAWPVARRAAALALGALPREDDGDRALAHALEDDAPWVRSAAAESLGARGVTRAADALRERLDDGEERHEVRRAAALALGALCDGASVEPLTKLIRRVDDPLATAEERALGEAALDALAALRPPDLAARLAPLAKGRGADAVRRALSRASASRCSAR